MFVQRRTYIWSQEMNKVNGQYIEYKLLHQAEARRKKKTISRTIEEEKKFWRLTIIASWINFTFRYERNNRSYWHIQSTVFYTWMTGKTIRWTFCYSWLISSTYHWLRYCITRMIDFFLLLSSPFQQYTQDGIIQYILLLVVLIIHCVHPRMNLSIT